MACEKSANKDLKLAVLMALSRCQKNGGLGLELGDVDLEREESFSTGPKTGRQEG